jgi:hypothetical protein
MGWDRQAKRCAPLPLLHGPEHRRAMSPVLVRSQSTGPGRTQARRRALFGIQDSSSILAKSELFYFFCIPAKRLASKRTVSFSGLVWIETKTCPINIFFLRVCPTNILVMIKTLVFIWMVVNYFLYF